MIAASRCGLSAACECYTVIQGFRDMARLTDRAAFMALILLWGCTSHILAAAALADSPDDAWPQWRGPMRDGRSPAAPTWPRDLSGMRELWRVPLGPSYSGPIVAKDRVFVTETIDRKWEVVRALDLKDGRTLWEARWEGAMSVPFFAKENGDWIRATPAYDGECLYVPGMCDVLVCLDADTGRERWRADFRSRYKVELPAFGLVCSPMVLGDFVYIQGGGSFLKLDRKTGETVWRTLIDGNGMYGGAFSSPIVATLCGERQLVVQTRQKLAGINIESGEELWSQKVPSFRGMNILTPTLFGDGILTSTHKNKTFFYRLSKGEKGYRVEEAWANRAQGYMSSPVVIGDHAYLHLGNGRLSCLDLNSGEQAWRSKPFGKYWSMASQGDRVLALDERGELVYFRASAKRFRLMGRKKVADSESWAHLAVCGSRVFVRDLAGLTVYAWDASTEAPDVQGGSQESESVDAPTAD